MFRSACRAKESHDTSRVPASPFVPLWAVACVAIQMHARCWGAHSHVAQTQTGPRIPASGMCGGCAFSEEIPCSLATGLRVSSYGHIPLKVINCFGSPETQGFPGIRDFQCGSWGSLRETGTSWPPYLSTLILWEKCRVCGFSSGVTHLTHV